MAQIQEAKAKRRERYIGHGLEPVVLEQERSEERVTASEKRVFSTPAASVAGFAAKVLVFCEQVGFPLPPGDPCEEFVHSMEADAKYLAEAGPATPAAALGADAALFALIGEKYVVQFVADHAVGDHVGPAGPGEQLREKLDLRVAALEKLIAATPARNLTVVMLKLWEMIDCLMSEGEDGESKTLLAQSALADVGSLAGEGEVALEADAVALAVRDLMHKIETFEGSATELLARLEGHVSEGIRDSRGWPKVPSALTGRLRRAAVPLRQVGIEVTTGFRDPGAARKRLIKLARTVAYQPPDGEAGSR